MQTIDVNTLKQKLSSQEDILLIDVRETFEHEQFNIGGLNIAMNEVLQNIGLIPREGTVVLYCEKGIRSMIVIQRLQETFGYNNLVNLSGGMQAWRASAL